MSAALGPERTFRCILALCSSYFGVSQAEILGRGRTLRQQAARATAMHLTRKHCVWSHADIGQAFDGRDETGVGRILASMRRTAESQSEAARRLARVESELLRLTGERSAA